MHNGTKLKPERVFSVELKSKEHVTNLTLTGGVSIEGTLGELNKAGFIEDIILEVEGSKGVLRVDLGKKDLAGIQMGYHKNLKLEAAT